MAKPQTAAAAAALADAHKARMADAAAKVGFDTSAKVDPAKTQLNPPIKTEKQVIDEAKAAEKKTEADRKAAQKAEFAKMKADADAAKKADREAKAKLKAEEAAAKKEERAKAKADREAKLAELGATGSMKALALGVKEGRYVKGVTGQLHVNDAVANAFDGVAPTDVIKTAMAVLKIDTNPYSHLNAGQQSMNLRNKLRGAIKAGTVKVEDAAAYIASHGIVRVTAESVAAKAEAKAKAKQKAADAAAKKKAEAEAAKAKAKADKEAEKQPAQEAA